MPASLLRGCLWVLLRAVAPELAAAPGAMLLVQLLMKYGQLHRLLASWKEAGGMIPFTFSDLVGHTAFSSDANILRLYDFYISLS